MSPSSYSSEIQGSYDGKLLGPEDFVVCHIYWRVDVEIYKAAVFVVYQSQWPRVLRRGSTAARLLGLWVRIPPGALMSVCVECCLLLGRGLGDGLMTRPEKS